ncbi:MAG: hypothetical protein MSS82_03075 [Bacteroidales bacterium]|nr:hypothetical protein [Bacteroidales bacterium]
MKRIYISILALCMVLMATAQAPADKTWTLAMKVVVEELAEPFPATARIQLTHQLNKLLTQNGIASSDMQNQFFITATATPLTKDILPGPPTQIAENMEITFYIADAYNQVIFSTTSLTAKGVGITEAKAYMNAIQHLNINQPDLQEFVQKGKTKVIDYYNTQADKMFAKARSLAFQKDYEQALYIVTCIPSECDRYEDALAMGNEIFQQYIDYLCDVNLAAAKTAWMAEQNSKGAENAGAYLQYIYPDAACYEDAQVLYQEIKGKVLDDWKFEMKKWQDGIDIEMAKIYAWRDIGVAYGTNQQPITTGWNFLR